MVFTPFFHLSPKVLAVYSIDLDNNTFLNYLKMESKIRKLSDSQLYKAMMRFNLPCGPVVDSTREFYMQRLINYSAEIHSQERKTTELNEVDEITKRLDNLNIKIIKK